MNIITKMKQDWDRRAKHHSRFWIATQDYQNEDIFAKSGQATADEILELLEPYLNPSWRVLDIGCGIGRILRPLASYFQHVIGVDVSAEMIAQSKEWVRDLKNVNTFETSGVDLRIFPSHYFNLVYSYVTFQHIPRPIFERYLEEINRVLTPGGFLAFQIPVGPCQDAPLEDTIAVRFYEMQDLQEKLTSNGFQLLDTQEANPVSPNQSEPTNAFHQFFLAQKTRTVKPEINVGWLGVECREYSSALDTRMYLSFAELCIHQGQQDEAIHTYKTLLGHNPSSLEAWLQLATLFIDSGKIDQAVSTLKGLTHTHPDYQEGHHTLNALLTKYKNHPTYQASKLEPTDTTEGNYMLG